MNQIIPVRCAYSHLLPIDTLNDLQRQSKNRTELMLQRLRTSILELGFAFPMFFWRDRKGQVWVLDGHGRLHVLKQLLAEGYRFVLPDGGDTVHVPALEIQARNKKEAYQLLLALNSRYGYFTEDGLMELAHSDSEFAEALRESYQTFALLPDVNLSILDRILEQSWETVADVLRNQLVQQARQASAEPECSEPLSEHAGADASHEYLQPQTGMSGHIVLKNKNNPLYEDISTVCPICGGHLNVLYRDGRWTLYPVFKEGQFNEDGDSEAV